MNEHDIFLAALEIPDLSERADYLNRACAGDAALRRQVESLLAAHLRSGEFLDVPAMQQMAAASSNAASDPAAAPGAETSAEPRGADEEITLSFLLPSAKPGSLGRLGHYEVEAVIGRGGCGIVLKAFDEMLHRVVAIKVMAPELAATSPARKRFLREARAAAAIRHENVVNIHAVEEQPIPFLVMEYVAGPTLQQKLDQTGPLDVREVVQIGHQIASGLEAAHAMGLIHRDIKPGNILLERGRDRVKITDFGLARTSDDASLTQSGTIAGTPLYMSPEQAMGETIDQRSDLFSLGSVLYVMCSGRPPFRAGSSLAVLKRVVEDQPRPIQEIIPEVPQWLSTLIARLHAKKPADRIASAHEVASLLSRCLLELQRHDPLESLADILPMVPQLATSASPLSEPENVKAGSPAVTELPSPRYNAGEGPGVRGDLRDRPAKAHRPWLAAAAAAVLLFAGLGLTEATGVTNVRATVIRLLSPDGTLVVEVDDPGVSVSIDGEEMVITGAGAKEIRLKPGQYKVLASKDGKLVRQELVTVTRNGRQVVRVSKEVVPVAAIGERPKAEAATAPRYTNSLGMEFALVPKGKAWLGGGKAKFGDRETEFMEDFYLGVNEVTQKEWKLVMGDNPSQFSRSGIEKGKIQSIPLTDIEQFPVENVTWDDCQAYLKKLNERAAETGWAYRLPTQTEWEYACRGGPMNDETVSAFDFYVDGPRNELTSALANYGTGSDKPPTEWLGRTTRTRSFPPNPLGLYDMHGNVWEWCDDRLPDVDGVQQRVFRGGAFNRGANLCTATTWVNRAASQGAYGGNGLRVARVRVEPGQPPATFVATPEQRKALEWVLSAGGTVYLQSGWQLLKLHQGDRLPDGPFATKNIVLNSVDAGKALDDSSLENLKSLPSFEQLRLTSLRVGDAGLAKLATYSWFGDLKLLALYGTPLTDAGMAHVKSAKSLTWLTLNNVPVTGKGLAHLRGLPLSTIGLSGCLKVGDDAADVLADIPTLSSLDLHGTAIGPTGIVKLTRLSNLRGLNVNGAAVTDDLAAVVKLQGLTSLLIDSPSVTDAGLARLTTLPELKDLVFTGSKAVTDAGVEHIAKCKNLRTFNVKRCGITESGVQKLASVRPDLKIEWDGGVIEPRRELGVFPPSYKNTLGMEFALVPKGKSWLGGGAARLGDRELEFKDDFFLGAYEVTQGEWAQVMGKNPSAFSLQGSLKEDVKEFSAAELQRFPVESVSWDDAQAFLKKLNAMAPESGWIYRLPKADEWEYACRGGPMAEQADSAFEFYLAKPTNQLRPNQANIKDDLKRSCKVGSYAANPLGLHDMHGNVWEWSAEGPNPTQRWLQGGCYAIDANFASAANRGHNLKSIRYEHHGLRVARVRAEKTALPDFAIAPFDEKQAKAHQEAWAKYLERKVVEENSLGMKLALIPPGKSTMGCADAEKDVGKDWAANPEEQPVHAVEITRPYLLSATEVSQQQFEKATGRNPSAFSAKGAKATEVEGVDSGNLPVETVSWYDAAEFCNLLSKQEGLKPYYELAYPVRAKDGSIGIADVKELGGLGYRLPSEAEWEYACRAGTVTRYYFAFDYGTLPQYNTSANTGVRRPHDVRQRKPNAFELHDMHGNVFEWCGDWFGAYTSDAARDPQGPAEGTERVARGGSYNYLIQYHRAAFRGFHVPPGSRHNNVGFRVARTLIEPKAIEPKVAVPLAEDGFVPLFNRQDLSGWMAKRSATIDWKNENGTITGRNRASHPNSAGQLTSQKQYKDFHFRCEVLAGSGVEPVIMFRNDDSLIKGARRGYALSDPLPGSPVIAQGWGHGSLYADDFQVPPHQSRLAPSGEKDLGIKTGDWYRLEFIARQETVEVRINGKKTAVFSSAAPALNKAGTITLRCGAGATIAFRNLEIKELTTRDASTVTRPAPSAALESLRRDQVAPAALAFAGGGEPKNAPASLVAVLGEHMPVHTAPVSLAFSPDGRWLASASFDATILLRDGATGNVRRALRGHTNGIGYVAFSSNSQTLVSGSVDGTIRIWSIQDDVEDTAAPQVLEPKLGQVKMALSADGRFLAACGSTSDAVKLWTWDQWDTPRTLTLPFQPSCLAFSADGKLLACGGDGKRPENPAAIQIFSTADGQPHSALTAHQKVVRSLVFAPNGKLLVSSGSDTTYVWDLTSGKPVRDLKHSSFPLAISPDGKTLALNRLGNVLLFDVPSGTKLDGTESLGSWAGMINSLAFSSDGKTLAIGDQFGAVNLYDSVGWKIRPVGRELGHRDRVAGVAPSLDGRTVLSVGLDRTLRRWDLEHPGTNEVLENDVTGNDDRLIISPNGETFVRWPDISVWDAATGDKRFTLGRSHRVIYSPDGKTIASTTFPDNTIRLWDVRLGREVHRFPAVKNSIAHALAFSGDGKLLAAVANHSSVVVWNVTTGAEVKTWQDSRILHLAFHPTRELLAMGHENGALSLWNPLTGEKIRTWSGHTRAASWMNFTPDGQTLITSGSDGTIRLWDLENPRASEFIALGPANQSIVCNLDASGKYLFAIGDSTAIFVLRLPGEVGGTIAAAEPDRRAAEWVLSIGGIVRVNGEERDISAVNELPQERFVLTMVNLTQAEKLSDDGLAHFKDCTGLKALYLSGPLVTDARLANFQNCKSLTDLRMPFTPVTDAGVAHFKNCQDLLHLDLMSTAVTDAGLVHFQGCHKLIDLCLYGTRVSDVGLANFQDCKQLATLRLEGTQVTDAGLAYFKDCKNLYKLLLNGTQVTDAGLAQFRDCKQFGWIHLADTRVTVAGLVSFKDSKSPYFDLQGTQISDADLKELAAMSTLFGLDLRRTKVTPAGIAELKKALPKCPIQHDGAADTDRRAAEWVLSVAGTVRVNGQDRDINAVDSLPKEKFVLTMVRLYRNPLTDEGLVHLRHCKGLMVLQLAGSLVTDEQLAHFEGCKNLTELRLVRTSVTDAGLVHFKDCKKLVALELTSSEVTDAGLAHFKDCKKLGVLALADTRVTDVGLVHFQGCRDLFSLDLQGTRVTGMGLAHFKDSPRLAHLGLVRSEVTDAGLAFLKDCPNLTHLYLSSTKVTEAGLAHVGQLSRLSWLELNQTDLTDEGMSHLSQLKQLAAVNLTGTKVTDAGLVHFKELKKLDGVTLIDTQIGDASIDIIAGWAKLTYINLVRSNVTEAGIKQLKAKRPNLRIYWDGGSITPKPVAADADRRAAEWVLSIGGLVVIDHPRVRTVSELTKLPSGSWPVTEINLHGKPVTDAMLTELAGLKNLQMLWLWETQVTDAGLKELADLKSLKFLTLRDTQVVELKGLSALSSLESLDLGYTSVADAGLKELAGMKSLQSVNLVGTKVTGAGLKELVGLTDLRSLIFQGTRVSDAGLQDLAGLKKLQWLSLWGTPVSDEGVKHLAGLTDLQTLDLSRTQVTDAGLKHLAGMQKLTTLSLVGTQVTDASLPGLGQLAGLTTVRVPATKVTKAGVEKFAALRPALKIEWDGGIIEPKIVADPDRRAAEWVLSVGGAVTIRIAGREQSINTIEELPPGAFQLTAVILNRDDGRVDDAGLAHFRGCKNLTKVNVMAKGVTDAGLAHFRDSKGLSSLWLIRTGLTDAGLAHFSECQDLTDIHLGGTGVTDAGMAIIKDFKKLRKLHLVGVKVTDLGLAHLRVLKLHTLDLNQTQVTDAGIADLNERQSLEVLYLGSAQISDAGLAHFQDCKNLSGLDLRNTKVTDAGMAHLTGCRKLTNLVLIDTKVGDKGLAQLKDCQELRTVWMSGTRLTDAGLETLKGFPHLTQVWLNKTKITAEGVAGLHKALPGCRINWDAGVIEPVSTALSPHTNDYDKLATGRWAPVLNGPGKTVEPRNAVFNEGRIEIENGHAYDKSIQAADVIVRAKVQKLRGQIIQLTLRDVLGVYYTGVYEFDAVERFGIGTRDARFRSRVIQHFNAAAGVQEGEYFELAAAAVGDTLTVYANGKRVGEIRDSSIARPGGVAVHAIKGKGVFKDVEVMVLDKPVP